MTAQSQKPAQVFASPKEFVNAVVALRPQVAAFDCDGTLWSGDVGEGFFSWEIREGVVSAEVGRAMRARYIDYKAGGVPEDVMCGEMVTMHQGMPESQLVEVASDYFEKVFPGKIFPEMQELIRQLHEDGCDVWAVSSSNEWLIRAGMKHFGIPGDRILAATAAVQNGIVTERIVRMPSGPGKPKSLAEACRRTIDAAFGNSRWDIEMLAAAEHPFAVNPNPDLEGLARKRSWKIYFPDGTASRHV